VEQQALEQTWKEEETEKQRVEEFARRNHFLISTAVIPGVYNSPFLVRMNGGSDSGGSSDDGCDGGWSGGRRVLKVVLVCCGGGGGVYAFLVISQSFFNC